MKYYFKLYVDEKIKEKQTEVVEKITNNKRQLETYLITLTKNEANHLEIFNSLLWIQ